MSKKQYFYFKNILKFLQRDCNYGPVFNKSQNIVNVLKKCDCKLGKFYMHNYFTKKSDNLFLENF